MKKIILALLLTSGMATAKATLPPNIVVAEKRHVEKVKEIQEKSQRDIENSKKKLIQILKKELKIQMKRGSLENASLIQRKINELNDQEFVPNFELENVSLEKAIQLQDGKKPWSNRGYVFVNLPKDLLGMKYYQYKARSGTGVTFKVNKNCILKVIVGGYKGDLPALAKWRKEGWRKRNNTKIKYTDNNKNNLFVLSKSARKGETIKMNDYSEYAGIIVLTN